MRTVQRLSIALAFGLGLPLQASASGGPQMTLSEVLSETKAVVHGTVVDQFSQWEENDGNKIIFTYSTLRVQDGQFGAFGPMQSVVVRTVGGSVDGYNQLLIDEASFALGEEVIVFLGLEDGWLHPSVVGFHQGKYTVSRNAAGRILGLRQDAGAQVEPRQAEKTPLIPLSRFVDDVRRARRGLLDRDTSVVHPLVRIR
jgi:hypothetical protein